MGFFSGSTMHPPIIPRTGHGVFFAEATVKNDTAPRNEVQCKRREKGKREKGKAVGKKELGTGIAKKPEA
jgi:hypothetical protein